VSYAVQYRPGVERDMARLPRNTLARIDRAILNLAQNPRPAGSKKLETKNKLYRIRIGDFRIVYEIDDANRIVIIAIVGNRRDVYRRL
jgi:mRNA interferase RelE/StbE